MAFDLFCAILLPVDLVQEKCEIVLILHPLLFSFSIGSNTRLWHVQWPYHPYQSKLSPVHRGGSQLQSAVAAAAAGETVTASRRLEKQT